MAIYNSQFGSGLMGLQSGFEGLAQGAAGRMHPESRKMRSEMSELTQWITPMGEIDPNAPRAIRKKLEELISQGKVHANPENVGEFYIGDNPHPALEQFKNQSFYDMWGHADKDKDPTRVRNTAGPQGQEVMQDPAMQEIMGNPWGGAAPQAPQNSMQNAMAQALTQKMMQPPQIQPQPQQFGPQMQTPFQPFSHLPPPMGNPTAQPPQGNPIEQALMQAMMQNSQAVSLAPPQEHMQQPMQQPPQQGPTLIDALMREALQGTGVARPLTRMESGGPVKKEKSQIDSFLELLGIDKSEIPIVAHEGEYVLNKDAVNIVGKENLEQINQLGQTIPRMERGGSVGSNPNSRGTARQNLSDQDAEGRATLVQMLSSLIENQQSPTGVSVKDTGLPQNMTGQDNVALPGPGGSISGDIRNVISGHKGSEAEKALMAEAELARIINAGPERLELSVKETGLPEMNRSREQEEADAAMIRGIDNEPIPSYWGGRPYNPTQGPGPVTAEWDRLPEHYYYPKDKLQANPNPEENPEVIPRKQIKDKPTEGEEESPPTPQKEGTIPKRESPRVYYRNPGAGMNVNWETVSDMEPAQAMQYLQQIANTQGRTTNINYGDNTDKRGELFRDLMSHYSNLTGIEDAVNDRYWKDLTMPHQVDKLKYEAQKIAAESPYFSAMAEADIDYSKARTRLLQSQASLAQKELESIMNGVGVDPSDMLKNYKTVQEIKNSYVQNLDNAVNTSFRFAEESGNKSAWQDFYEKSLLRDFVTGSRDIDEDYKVIVETIGKGTGIRGNVRNTLSEESVSRMREAAREHRKTFTDLEKMSNPGDLMRSQLKSQQSGNSELAALLASLGILGQ